MIRVERDAIDVVVQSPAVSVKVVREGPPGPANALTIGTVDTGAPGSSALASITGTPPAQVLDLTIPTGHTGPAGPAIGGLLTSKGDLAVHNGSAVARLPVGGEGQSLTVSGGAVVWQPSRVGNLLTPNQASVETDTTGLVVTNVGTVARSTAQAYHGTASLLVTATQTPPAVAAGTSRNPSDPYRVPVQPGVVYTGSMMVLSQSRQCRVRLLWWNANGGNLGDTGGSGRACTSWTLLQATGVAPSTAAYCSLEVDMTNAGAVDDTAHVDCLGVWLGAGGDWAMPGEPILNQGRRVTRPNGTDRLVEVWDGTAWVVTHYDSGWRDVTAATIDNGETQRQLRLRRIGSVVHVRLSIAQTLTATQKLTTSMPPGFQLPSGAIATALLNATGWATSAAPAGQAVFYTFNCYYRLAAAGTYFASASYATDDPIPASLPGILATPAS